MIENIKKELPQINQRLKKYNAKAGLNGDNLEVELGELLTEVFILKELMESLHITYTAIHRFPPHPALPAKMTLVNITTSVKEGAR